MAKNSKKIADKTVQNSLTKVLFLNENLLQSEVNHLEILTITLPRKTSMFITSEDSIFELLQFNEKFRSWFINETVSSNGKIYFTTRVDPLFIFIQYLERDCKTRAQPLDQIMGGEADIFMKFLKLPQIKMVADQKGPEDLKAFMFNEEKTLKWLKKKFELTRKSLREQQIVSSGASSLNYVKSSADDDSVDEEAIDETALGIISEYISLDLIKKLDSFYGISEKSKEPLSQKRKSQASNGNDSKKIKIEEQENFPDKSPPNQAPVKVTSKAKAFEKAAKGTKSISSFFAKK